MMRYLNKKFRRDFAASLPQFFSVFMMVAVSVTIYSGMSAVWTGMAGSYAAYAEQTNLADAYAAGEAFPEDSIEEVRRLPFVSKAAGSLLVRAEGGAADEKNAFYVNTFDDATLEVMSPLVRSGEPLGQDASERGDGGIWIDEDYANAHGISTGDLVTLDGNDVTPSGGQYFVTLTAGCVVDIKADYPNVSYPVKFNFTDEKAKGVISKVMADGEEVKNYNDADFKLKAGTKLSLTFDQRNYALDAFKVNGTATTIYGTYECYVKDNLVFDIQAHKYATVKAVLTVDNAANITAYEGQSYNNKVITLQNGSNNIELGEKNNLIQIKPNSGCKIESIKANGTPVTANYEGAYEIRLTDGMTIEVTTSAIVRDQKATVVIDDISLANYGFNFYRSDRCLADAK